MGLGLVASGCVGAPRAPTRVAALAPSSACFPIDTLPGDVRALAEHVLLDAADGEALYTLAGGLKPLSSGRSFSYQIAPRLDRAALDSLDQLRRATTAISCDPIGAFVHVFNAAQTRPDGRQTRAAEIVVYHRASVSALVARHAQFFGELGISPAADVREVLAAVENAPREARWRGYGLLFGYPTPAVDFFVRAGAEGDSTGTLVPRDFVRIETFRKFPASEGAVPTLSTFVYAVPKGAAETDADRSLRESAAPIYARYARERARYVRADSTGATALWRAWLAPRAGTERVP